ncbi:MAG: hypothetical protein RR518_09430 [Coprobacillus sp.]
MNKVYNRISILTEVSKQILKGCLIFSWTYLVCLNVYNSTVFSIYQNTFLDGIASTKNLPKDLIQSLPDVLKEIIFGLTITYIIVVIIEFLLKNNIKKSVWDIILIAIIPFCIKIPEFLLIGFFAGNEEFLIKTISYILIGGTIMLLILKYFIHKNIERYNGYLKKYRIIE